MAKRRGKCLLGVVLVGALVAGGVWLWKDEDLRSEVVARLMPRYGMSTRGEADQVAELGDDLTEVKTLSDGAGGDLAEGAKTETDKTETGETKTDEETTETDETEDEIVVALKYDPGDLTNGDVTVTLEGLPEEAEITNNGGENSFVFTENGKFTFKYKVGEKEGQTVATVDWIDKAAPKVKIEFSTQEETSEPVIARLVSVTEGEEGEPEENTVEDFEPIASAKYDANGLQYGEEFTVTNNDGEVEYTFDEDGEFTFEYRDKAGNTGTMKAEVNWIRKEAPGTDDDGDDTPGTGDDDDDPGDGDDGGDDSGDDENGGDNDDDGNGDGDDDGGNSRPGGSTAQDDSNWMNAGGVNADDGQGLGMAGYEGMNWGDSWGANTSDNSGEGVENNNGNSNTGNAGYYVSGAEVADNSGVGGEAQIEATDLPEGVKVENKKLTLNSTLRQKFGSNSEYFELSFVNGDGEATAERPEEVKITIASSKKLTGVYRVKDDGTTEPVEYEKLGTTQVLIKNPEAGKYLLDYEEVVNDSEISEDALVGPTNEEKPWYETQALWWVVGGVAVVVVLGLVAKAVASRKGEEEEE